MTHPTILIPGFGDTVKNLWGLNRYLQNVKLNPLPLSPQPSNGMVGIEILAQRLAEQIAQNISDRQKFNLVGFSMGGLIARYYIQRLGGYQRVEKFITLSSPHQGTWSAYLFRQRPACIQMRPHSPFLHDLNEDTAHLEEIKFTSIWTPLDLTIRPARSSCLPVATNRQIISPVHGLVSWDPRVHRLVSALLRD